MKSESSLFFWKRLVSSREAAGVDLDADAFMPVVPWLVEPEKTLGNSWTSRERTDGRQAQITPTSHSIVLQYPTGT